MRTISIQLRCDICGFSTSYNNASHERYMPDGWGDLDSARWSRVGEVMDTGHTPIIAHVCPDCMDAIVKLDLEKLMKRRKLMTA